MIESISVNGPSATIKSHHNVGGLPDFMKLDLVEPLRMLFKDEVRRVGKSMYMEASLGETILGALAAREIAVKDSSFLKVILKTFCHTKSFCKNRKKYMIKEWINLLLAF